MTDHGLSAPNAKLSVHCYIIADMEQYLYRLIFHNVCTKILSLLTYLKRLLCVKLVWKLFCFVLSAENFSFDHDFPKQKFIASAEQKGKYNWSVCVGEKILII